MHRPDAVQGRAKTIRMKVSWLTMRTELGVGAKLLDIAVTIPGPPGGRGRCVGRSVGDRWSIGVHLPVRAVTSWLPIAWEDSACRDVRR